MILAGIYIVPPLAAIILSRGRSHLRADLRSLATAAAALACLASSGLGLIDSSAPVVAAFALGALALGQVVWLTSGRRWLTAVAVGGASANVVAVAGRGAMPVSAAARAQITDQPIAEPELLAAKHIEISALRGVDWLGDVIPVAPLDAVVSLGDIVVVLACMATGLLARQHLPAD